MTNFCPEWIFGSCCAESARHFILYNTPLVALSKKYSNGLNEHYNEISFEEINGVSEEMIRFLDEINALSNKAQPPGSAHQSQRPVDH